MLTLMHRTYVMVLIKLCLSLLMVPVFVFSEMTEQDQRMRQKSQQIQHHLLFRDGKQWELVGSFPEYPIPEFHQQAHELMMSQGVHPIDTDWHWNVNPFRRAPKPAFQYYFSVVPHDSPLGWEMGLKDHALGNHATAMILWKQSKHSRPILLNVDVLRDNGFVWEQTLVPVQDVIKHL